MGAYKYTSLTIVMGLCFFWNLYNMVHSTSVIYQRTSWVGATLYVGLCLFGMAWCGWAGLRFYRLGNKRKK